MSFCFCGKYAPYEYKRKNGDKVNFCLEHAPKPKKPQKQKKEIEEKPLELTEEKTGALYYDN